jgi:hypothetical protein
MKKYVKFLIVLLVLVLAALAPLAIVYADDGAGVPLLTLGEAIAWVLSGGGAGALTYLLIDKVGFLRTLAPDYKRYASLGITALFALLAWGAGMGMGYLEAPMAWRGWIEASFSIIAVALTTAQAIHGYADLRQWRLAETAGIVRGMSADQLQERLS